MGYIRHHAIVVTSWDNDAIEDARRQAEVIGCNPSQIVGPLVNNTMSFFVPPDGSKEGWTDSNVGDRRRDALVEWLKREWHYSDGSTPIDWAEVRYGDDDGVASLTRASDETLSTGNPEKP